MAKTLPEGVRSLPRGVSYALRAGSPKPHQFILRDPTTHGRETQCFATVKDGMRWADATLAAFKAGAAAAGKVPWAKAGEAYLDTLAARNRRQTYIGQVQSIVDALEAANVGNIKSEAFPVLVRRWLEKTPQREGSRTPGKPASPATRNKRLAIIRAVVNHACANHRIPFDPLNGLGMAKVRRVLVDTLTVDELRSCLSPAQEHRPYFLRFALLAYLGVRDTEGLHLLMEDYDHRRGVWRIREQPELYHLKSGEREIPVPDELAAIVLPLKLRRATGYALEPEIRLRHDGKAVVGDKTDYDRFQRYLKDCGVTRWADFGRHSMRHLWARLLSATGVVPSTLRRWAGHEDSTTTMRYCDGSDLYEKAVAGWPRGQLWLRRETAAPAVQPAEPAQAGAG